MRIENLSYLINLELVKMAIMAPQWKLKLSNKHKEKIIIAPQMVFINPAAEQNLMTLFSHIVVKIHFPFYYLPIYKL